MNFSLDYQNFLKKIHEHERQQVTTNHNRFNPTLYLFSTIPHVYHSGWKITLARLFSVFFHLEASLSTLVTRIWFKDSCEVSNVMTVFTGLFQGSNFSLKILAINELNSLEDLLSGWRASWFQVFLHFGSQSLVLWEFRWFFGNSNFTCIQFTSCYSSFMSEHAVFKIMILLIEFSRLLW